MSDAATNEPAIPPAAAGGDVPTSIAPFCFKSQHQVKELISGPTSIFICDECLEFCTSAVNHLLESGSGQSRKPSKTREANSSRSSIFYGRSG